MSHSVFLLIFGMTVSGFEHDEENMRTSKDSSGTEYDDVDEKHVKPEDSSPTEPSLPPRPDNLLGTVTFLISQLKK